MLNRNLFNPLVAENVRFIQPAVQQVQSTRYHFASGAYVAIATKPVHRLQICPTVHSYTFPRSYSRVRAIMWECSEGQTDTGTHTDGRRHNTFRWAMPNAKCSNCLLSYRVMLKSKDVERTVGINCRYLGALQNSELSQQDRAFLVEVSALH